MTLRDFLLDRATYLIAFVGALALALTVVGLAGSVGDRPLSASNLGYIGLLTLFCLGCYVVRDYTQQRAFRAQVTALLEQPELTSFAVLDHPATREQAVVCDLVRLQHRLSRDELNAYQRQQEINSVFMNRWAHQMKTPVAVIDATLQEEERAGHCPAELLTSLREETDKLASGLELMLSSARLGEFRSDFVVHRTDLVELVRHSINNHRRAFIRRGVYPSLTVPPEPVLADTDEKWLRFVVDQLLTNAIKYSDPARAQASGETPTVAVRVEAQPHAARIAVSDQGIGIPEQDLARVFEPFFTGENGRTNPEATGMGLYLARTVCDRLGHGITISSCPGEGTTVTVTIQRDAVLHDKFAER